MTQINTAVTGQSLSRWQKLLAWLRSVEQALDYDPQEHTDAGIKELKAEIDRLNARLDAAEGSNQRAA